MCEFCVRHGDGQRWYRNAANYSDELLRDTARRDYIKGFIPSVRSRALRNLRLVDRLFRISPWLTRRVLGREARTMQSVHYGQVLPIEEVAAVLDLAGQVTRFPCVCRTVLERREVAACYLLGLSPERLGMRELLGAREEGAPFVSGMERVGRDEAIAQMLAMEDRGTIHTVWTFHTPFVAAVCNCDPSGCLAMNFSRRGLPLYFPAEDRVALDPHACTGCGACADACHFGALSLAGGVMRLDPARCHGCGICRRRCPSGALALPVDQSCRRAGFLDGGARAAVPGRATIAPATAGCREGGGS